MVRLLIDWQNQQDTSDVFHGDYISYHLQFLDEAIHHLLDFRDPNTWMLFGTLPIYPCINDEQDQALLQRLRDTENVTMRKSRIM